MKKKTVHVLISAVIIILMLFTVTACGSEDNEAVPVEQLEFENMVNTDEEFSGAKNEELPNEAAENADIMTVDDWIATEEAATYIQALNTSLDSTGALITFEADGDVLCMIFNYSEEAIGTDGSDLTDEQKEAEQTRLQQKYDSIKEQLEPMCDVFREAIGDSGLVVRIIYKTSNGTEIFTQDL